MVAAGPPDGPAVILLHGFPEDATCWSAVTPVLNSAGFRTLAPHQRGYSAGAQPRSRRAYRLAALAGDVLALADQAGAERFDVVGHDWGAIVAWYLAGFHADRLRSVTALSVPHPGAWRASLGRSTQALRSWYMLAFQLPRLPEAALARRGGAALAASLRRTGLDPLSAGRYAARSQVPGALIGPLNWYRALPFDRAGIGPSPRPTLFVWGDGDRFMTRAAAARCGAYVTGPFRAEVLEGGSHWLPEAEPARVAALLLDHLG